ncbi:MAG: hypothetical protein IAF94_19135 [Pirellulaceae bacterium]|nr:hypothetical protein [Pirellulaceae bacterium]
MKYSLRSLMIVVTLVAVVLGGRLEYIRRQIAFHRREAASAHAAVAEKEYLPIAAAMEHWTKAAHHERVADAYERTRFRPWTLVDESAP